VGRDDRVADARGPFLGLAKVSRLNETCECCTIRMIPRSIVDGSRVRDAERLVGY